MWTPRRIFLSLMSLLISASLYFGYAQLLGSFDGLPPLPEEYKIDPNAVDLPPLPATASTTEQQIVKAFGEGCAELHYPSKFWMKQRGVLICFHEFSLVKEGPRAGWVQLSPLSIASFSEKKGADGLEEINTVYCDMAYVKFDRPIKMMGDLNGRKMMAAELHANPEAMLGDPRKGRIRLLNNRRTHDENDDIELVTPGPVYYEADPRPGQPNIYTFTAVQIFDYVNTNQVEPDRNLPREPTIAGVGLRVFMNREPKDKAPRKTGEPVVKGKRESKPAVSGIESVGFDHSVEMNIWSDSDSSFIAPGSKAPAKKEVTAKAKEKDKTPPEKRLIQLRTEGPFRYDLNRELAHFEKPATQKPGLVEHVTVTRADNAGGQDLLDCEYLDVQFHRRKPDAKADEKGDRRPPKKKDGQGGEGDLEVQSIRAWGETVVMTSDLEKLNATGSELIHDAERRITILKGSPNQQVVAVKEGNLLRGSEMHLYGDEKQISQAHILGVGSIGLGEFDPKTGEYQKTASWDDRLVYQRIEDKGQPPLDVFTFLSKDGKRAMFRDTASGALQQLEAQQLKVWVKPDEKDKKDKLPKKGPVVKIEPKKIGKTEDKSGAARVVRLEATGLVRSQTPDLVIRHTDHMDVWFQDVSKLHKPPKKEEPKDGKQAVNPKDPPKLVDAKESPKPMTDPKTPAKNADDKKVEPKKEQPKEKFPFVVVAKEIKSWVNRDPEGNTEIDRVHAEGDVEAHQAPDAKEKQGNDVAGQTVDIQAYPEGNKMVVVGDSSDRSKLKWGVVRSDKLTIFGFHITIDQRNDTGVVKGEGEMEILSSSDMDGKKLENPTTMHIYWTHHMDFFGADKLIYYHGGVQAFQEGSRGNCEWMQVLLDRPVHLDPERRDKAKPKPKPGAKEKEVDDTAKIDTIMCFHLPKDDDVPKPKTVRPVTLIDETKVDGKIVKSQTILAPDVVIVMTPLEDKKSRKEITATSAATMPGIVRIWQAGARDSEPAGQKKKEPAKKDGPARKKGELGPDEEMKLTIVQFGEKMWAEDFRKRAKFWTNVRVVHLPADRPNMQVDLREGDIPKGAIYLEARDTLEVFSTTQREKGPDGKEVDVEYQEMIAIGNVRVRKQGEYFGDADKVTYSELKGTLTLHGTERNPAVFNRIRGAGVPTEKSQAQTIVYYVKEKTVGERGGIGIKE